MYAASQILPEVHRRMRQAGWVKPTAPPKPKVVKFYGHATVLKEWGKWPEELKTEHVKFIQSRIEAERTHVLG